MRKKETKKKYEWMKEWDKRKWVKKGKDLYVFRSSLFNAFWH